MGSTYGVRVYVGFRVSALGFMGSRVCYSKDLWVGAKAFGIRYHAS